MINFPVFVYHFQGMVQFDEEHKPCVCGNSIRWLDFISIYALCERSAVKKALRQLNAKYPEYGGFVQLF